MSADARPDPTPEPRPTDLTAEEERGFEELVRPLWGDAPPEPRGAGPATTLDRLRLERRVRAARLREACLVALAAGGGTRDARPGAGRTARRFVLLRELGWGEGWEPLETAPRAGSGGGASAGRAGAAGRRPPPLEEHALRLARRAQTLCDTPDGRVLLAAVHWCRGEERAAAEWLAGLRADAGGRGWRERAVDPSGTARLARLLRALMDLERGETTRALETLARLARGGEGTRALLGGLFLLGVAGVRGATGGPVSPAGVPGDERGGESGAAGRPPSRAVARGLRLARETLDELVWRAELDERPFHRGCAASVAEHLLHLGGVSPGAGAAQGPRAPVLAERRAVEALLARARASRDDLVRHLAEVAGGSRQRGGRG